MPHSWLQTGILIAIFPMYMPNEIEELRSKIEKSKSKRQELLAELGILHKKIIEEGRKGDLKKIEELKEQILNTT